jgi:hypothetical protein
MRFFSNLKRATSSIFSGLKRNSGNILSSIRDAQSRSNNRRVSELNDDEKIALIVAKESYETTPKRFIPSNNGMYELVYQQTTQYFKPYVNHERKTIMIGVRGTEVSDTNDLIEDFHIIRQDLNKGSFVEQSQRINMLREKISTLRRLYSGYSIVLSGHSLGGRLAKEVSRNDSSIRAITFNAGGLDRTQNVLDSNRTNITDITTGTDAISLGSLLNQNVKVYNPRGLGVSIDSHKLDAFF